MSDEKIFENLERESDSFLAACQARGITVVPIDNNVDWLSSLNRTNPGDHKAVVSRSIITINRYFDFEPLPYQSLRRWRLS